MSILKVWDITHVGSAVRRRQRSHREFISSHGAVKDGMSCLSGDRPAKQRCSDRAPKKIFILLPSVPLRLRGGPLKERQFVRALHPADALGNLDMRHNGKAFGS